MAGFGDYYNKNKKKLSKEEQAKKALKNTGAPTWVVPTPQVIKKGKKDQPTW